MRASVYRITKLSDGRWELRRDGAKKPTGTYRSLFEVSSRAAELVEMRPNCRVFKEKEETARAMPG